MDILLFSRFATCSLTCLPQPVIFSSFPFEIINLRGCLRKQPAFHNTITGFSMKWRICGMAAEIPYQWHITSRIWVVLWIGRTAWEICFNKSEAQSRGQFCKTFTSVVIVFKLQNKWPHLWITHVKVLFNWPAIWEVTRHLYGISALVSQMSLRGKIRLSVRKCRLFF